MKSIKKISIILPPDGSTNSAVALVDWKPGNYPNFICAINEDPSKSWEIDFEQSQISFDRHFLGFTQLYTTKAEKPISADIIALTGLDGHAYGSFRGRGNLGKMWLREFLPKDLPTCRTMIYGYDSKLSSHGIDTIMDYGRGFLEAIKKIRKTKEELRRPLFFIAHSFGGIIVAHSICKASMINDTEDESIVSLYKAIYGLLLFGIPHKGLAVENIREMFLGNNEHPRQDLLDQIDEKSYSLISQLSDFKNVLRGRKVVSFYEQSQTRSLVQDKNGGSSFSRTGDYATAVETDSALLQLPDTMEVKIPLQLDHSQLVKFDNQQEQSYTSALHYLQEFERDAPAVVADRFSPKRLSLVPSSNVPYPRDRNFIGREDILKRIEAQLFSTNSHSRVALVGLGGMGKSQIAIEFSHRVRETSEDKWVFWVYANTIARFQQSYRDIANTLKLDRRDDSKVDILQLVSEWLKDERNGNWLLIIDNADDACMFSPPDTQAATKETTRGVEITTSGDSEAETRKNLLAYIPASRNGAVLVTSRNKDAAHRIAGNHVDDLIEVNKMAESEALHLLKVKLPEKQCLDGSLDLLAELDNIPLSITQAAAYISQSSQRMDVLKYLALFQKNDKHRTSLLYEDAGDLRRDSEVPNAVIRTWQISFNQIRRDNQPAADLLSLMSVLNRQGIPESFLLEKIHDELELENSLKTLLGFSLITSEIGGELFDMHRLVQLATRKWLDSQNTLDRFNQDALELLSYAFPIGEFENWKQCALLLPHVEAILECNFKGEDNLLQKARILYRLSWYRNVKGEYQLARLNIEEAIRTQEHQLGEKDLDLGLSYNLYGLILKNLGRYEDAEIRYQKDLEISKEVNGERHPHTLTSINNIGGVLWSQGKYEEAESLHRQALRFWREELGERHPDTLIIMNNLGVVLERQDKYEEAESLHQQALRLRTEELGERHPHTLDSMDNLGLALESQGKYEEAESLHRQALRFQIEELGERHPDTLISMNNLGLVLEKQGKYEEAEVTYRDLIGLQEVVIGSEHPEHLTTLNNLAFLLGNMKKYAEASVYYQKACTGRKKALGKEHPETKATLNNYAVMARNMDDTEENKLLYQKEVLQLYDEIFGPENPEALIAVYNLAYDLGKVGEYIEASTLFQRAYLGECKLRGTEDAETIKTKDQYSYMLDEITDPETKRIVQRQYDETMNGNTFVSRLHKNYWMVFHVSDELGCVIVGMVFCQMLVQHSGSVRRRFLSQR